VFWMNKGIFTHAITGTFESRTMGRHKVKITNSYHWYTKSSIIAPKAFTLIELLVVISVIVLLIAILLPALRRAKNLARETVCQANLKQWGQIMDLYTQESEGRFPELSLAVDIYILRGPYEENNHRVSAYAPVSTEGISCCPTATQGPGDSTRKDEWTLGIGMDSWQGELRYGGTFRAWEITGLGSPFQCSYGFNGWFCSYQAIRSNFIIFAKALDTFSLRGSANIPIFLDATRDAEWPSGKYPPPPVEGHDGNYSMRPFSTFCINRHNGRINGLFLDWSVRKIGLKELWKLNWDSEFDTANPWTKAGGVQPEDWPEWMRRFKDY